MRRGVARRIGRAFADPSSAVGVPLAQLLQLGARALLAAGYADRPGCGSRRAAGESPAQGCVVEAKAGPIPEQWKLPRCPQRPFLRAALESPIRCG